MIDVKARVWNPRSDPVWDHLPFQNEPEVLTQIETEMVNLVEARIEIQILDLVWDRISNQIDKWGMR